VIRTKTQVALSFLAMGAARSPAVHGAGTRRDVLVGEFRRLLAAIREDDERTVQEAVVSLSQSRRVFAPLALVVGASVMLFKGLKLLVSNWRLMLIQVLPAMWIWLATLDLKAHALRGRNLNVLRGPVLIPIVVAITALTAASFFLNAVFAFAIVTPGQPEIRPAFAQARAHRRVVLGWGVLIGLALGFATMVAPRWGLGWFTISLGVVVGVMMFCYVAIPSRLLGITKADVTLSRRDKVAATALGGAIGAIVCTPPYVLCRVGILMLGSHALFVPGVILLVIGLGLQAGATGSVKAIKMSTKLLVGPPADATSPEAGRSDCGGGVGRRPR
jgi:hypothetical protein